MKLGTAVGHSIPPKVLANAGLLYNGCQSSTPGIVRARVPPGSKFANRRVACVSDQIRRQAGSVEIGGAHHFRQVMAAMGQGAALDLDLLAANRAAALLHAIAIIEAFDHAVTAAAGLGCFHRQ